LVALGRTDKSPPSCAGAVRCWTSVGNGPRGAWQASAKKCPSVGKAPRRALGKGCVCKRGCGKHWTWSMQRLVKRGEGPLGLVHAKVGRSPVQVWQSIALGPCKGWSSLVRVWHKALHSVHAKVGQALCKCGRGPSPHLVLAKAGRAFFVQVWGRSLGLGPSKGWAKPCASVGKVWRALVLVHEKVGQALCKCGKPWTWSGRGVVKDLQVHPDSGGGGFKLIMGGEASNRR